MQYRVLEGLTPQELSVALNKSAVEGWEFVTLQVVQGNSSMRYVAVMQKSASG